MIVGLILAAALPLTPNPALTPGVVNPQCTVQIACVDGYTAQKGVRNVSGATKSAVFKEYGVDPKVGGPFEIDHLISLELCGANDIHNLWPQSYTTMPNNAHVKDALEDRLHKLVCTGQVPLSQAQHDISTDWVAAYGKYITNRPK